MMSHFDFSGPSEPVVSSKLSRDISARRQSGLYRNGGKRLLDLALVLASLPFVLPIILVLMVVVAVDGGQPFYRQERVGRDGRIFRMWKLRTMVIDAEAALQTHLENCSASRAEWDATQKLRRDPRITWAGRFLRKSSLDELPQLLNVFMGDMSLVGPRPMMPCQRDLYPGTAYYGLRPGITGLWQVSARNTSAFAERADYDTRYDRSLSLWTDLRLLVATLRVVLRGTGC